MTADDTIAAVSTAAGEGGIGIVRLSGPASLRLALAVFCPRAGRSVGHPQWTPEVRRLYYGSIHRPGHTAPDNARPENTPPDYIPPDYIPIDDGFLVYMKAPGSYTGEDVVELHCHGGSLVTSRVLEAVIAAGARIAGPGEFTRRAFVNGRMDLARAEAVIDVIRAETDSALSSARGRLDGHLSAAVNRAKELLAGLLVRVEAELDFPEEEEVEGLPASELAVRAAEAGRMIKRLLGSYSEGRALREGVRTVILGRPNVGKSSLLNLLLAEERAIVTPVPGTTRDVIEEVVNIRGLPVRLMDTAGLRDTTDHIEAIGVERARERAAGAQVTLFVVDATSGDLTEDLSLASSLDAEGRRTIIVANKADLVGPEAGDEDRLRQVFSAYPVCFVSALMATGIDELGDLFYTHVTGHPPAAAGAAAEAPAGHPMAVPAGEIVTSLRHKRALEGALEGIERLEGAAKGGAPVRELVATDLRWSIDRLGEITGETTAEDILERIFSDFCIGK